MTNTSLIDSYLLEMIFPNIYAVGDQAITIEFGNALSEKVNDQCIAFMAALKKKNLAGVKDIIPAYTTVTLIYNAVMIPRASNETAFSWMKKEVIKLLNNIQPGTTMQPRKLTIPVCYHPSVAPDLIEMAETKACSIDKIIELHSAKTYRVYMLGFLPGFPYMGKVDDFLEAPRKKIPHTNISAGSIGIAGLQTGIYPLNSPGGWNIIAQTPLQLFDPGKTDPVFFHAGDEVQFQPISLQQFQQQIKNNH